MGGETSVGDHMKNAGSKSVIEEHAGKILVTLLCVMIVGAFVWWRDMSIDAAVKARDLSEVQISLKAMDTKLDILKDNMADATRSRWTSEDEKASQLRQDNRDRGQDDAIGSIQVRIGILENRVGTD